MSRTPRPFQAHAVECRLLAVERIPQPPPPRAWSIAEAIVSATGAPLVSIYGAGAGARAAQRELARYGLEVRQFIDRNERLGDTTIDSIPSRSVAQAMEEGETRFVIGSALFAADMARTIEQAFEGRAVQPTIFNL